MLWGPVGVRLLEDVGDFRNGLAVAADARTATTRASHVGTILLL